MDPTLYFDYCAAMILVLLLTTVILRKLVKGNLGRIYTAMIIATLIACLGEIWFDVLVLMDSDSIIQMHMGNTIYFIFHNASLPLLLAYTIAVTDTKHILLKKKLFRILFYVPISVSLVAIIANIFTPVIFYFNDQGEYTRADYILLLYAVAAVYGVWGIVHSIRYRKSMGVNRFISIMTVYFFSVLAVVLQYFTQYQLEMFFNSLGLLFILMMIQRPEYTIDSETGLYKLKAYLAYFKTAFINEKQLEVIQVNITNYKALREMLGYERVSGLMRKIGSMIEKVNSKHKLSADIYSLGAGKLRLVIEEKSFNMTVEVAEEINEILQQEIDFEYGELNVVANVCIVKVPQDISNLESLMAFGDDLNTIPFSGKVLYASEIYKKRYYDIMRDIDKIIEKALNERRFEVYYQPIFSLNENRFNSAEALLRLNDEKYGFISPEIFIHAAEKSGAIHRVGTYVLEEVCKFIASESFKELNLDYIEVNLSVAQCMQKDLADKVLETLDKYGVKPEQINLEITETAVAYSAATLMDNLDKLTKAGIHLSLDDFGTGYSNMRRIALLPLKIVKLDRSMTNAENTPNMQIVLEDAINMIKHMNMEIVVEGVETEELLKTYADLKCEYIQGYYYSKPIPKDDFIEFILNS